jgi:hypothetical protein
MTGLHRCYGQTQSLSDFSDAEVFEIPQKDDAPVFLRQPAERSVQPANGLASLTFNHRRLAFTGDRKLSECGKIKCQNPRSGTSSPPCPGLVETNSNQPGTETGFKPKLLEMDECFNGSLLDNVLGVRMTANYCPDCIQQWRKVRRYQISEEISTPAEDISYQFCFFRARFGMEEDFCGHRWNRPTNDECKLTTNSNRRELRSWKVTTRRWSIG